MGLEHAMVITLSIGDLKRGFSEVCNEVGLPPSTAFGIFAHAVECEHEIPFVLSAVSSDGRYVRLRGVSGGRHRRGLADMEFDYIVTREESRAMCAAKHATA